LKLQVPVGTCDYLPDACAEKRNVENIIRNEFLLGGYEEIETPSFEYYDVFMHDSVPYVQENMIKFFDSRGRILALRPDMTGPIARMAATKMDAEGHAARLCYIGNVYGYKSGSQRAEFTQAGIELIGEKSAEADAEVIALAIQALLSAGLYSFKIDIGQVAYFKAIAEGAGLDEEQKERVRMLVDSKNSVELEYELSRMKLDGEVKRSLLELTGMFGGIEVLEQAGRMAANEKCSGAVGNLKDVYGILKDYGFEDYISIDFGLLNNFNYYSGIIFRGIAQGIGVPLLSGGRYDMLLAEFGKELPATGFAMGINELLTVLGKQDAGKESGNDKIKVVKCGGGNRRKAIGYARGIREKGGRAILDFNGGIYDEARYEVIKID